MITSLYPKRSAQSTIRFGNLREAVQAIQNTTKTESTVAVLTNQGDLHIFTRKLAKLKLPVGVVLVTQKD